MKIKIITLLTAALLFNLYCSAQNSGGKSDDLGRIVLNSFVSDQIEGLPSSAEKMLENKLSEIATKNGMGGSALAPRFIITPNVTVLTKDLTATAPPMTALTLEVTFYIGDGIEGTKFASQSITVKGVGTNENKAYIAALKQIKPANPEIQAFVTKGKEKIIEYYNAQCDFLLKEAQTLADQKQYWEAIYKLSVIPEVSKECYMKAQDMIKPMYQAYIDDQCKKLLNDAKNAWNSDQTWSGAEVAGGYLSAIDPDAACYSEATQLMNTIQKKVLADETRDWNFKMKVWNDQVSLESQRIKAVRDVGVAYGNNQPQNVTYNTNGWW